jgi:protein required for attachment to host cells
MIDNGKIYQPSGRLDAKLIVKDKKRAIPLKIAGTTSNPKIKLDNSFIKDELKQKAKERVKKEGKRLKEKLKKRLEEKLKDKLKDDIAKDLFKKLF